MKFTSQRIRALGLTTAVTVLAGCVGGGNGPLNGLDWDLRGGNGALDTSGAALRATEARPTPDGRGVISYPGYQVAVARRGDTVTSVAARVGLNADELGRYNALKPTDMLREGEVLALPRRVGDGTPGLIGAPAGGGAVDVSAIATTALDRVDTGAAPTGAKPSGTEPVRHLVRRGETAFSIARTYNISAKALGEWNGLGSDLNVREGQYLIIPTVAQAATLPPTEIITKPGDGTPTPTPPSAAKPLPAEKTVPAATKPKDTPASPDLAKDRTVASSAKMAMPVAGSIVRPYAKGKNEGIDISAAAGTAVKAADAGTVAAITKNTEQTPIIVLRHAGNLLTVYAGVDAITVKKGDKVARGQTIAKLKASSSPFLHFEVRKGVESTDPAPFLK